MSTMRNIKEIVIDMDLWSEGQKKMQCKHHVVVCRVKMWTIVPKEGVENRKVVKKVPGEN